MRKWPLVPFNVDMSVSPIPSPPTFPGLSFPVDNYSASNAAYGSTGNLLFYVVDREGFSQITNANGSVAGVLGDYFAGVFYIFPSNEVAIVPKPGTCSTFYVIYTRMNVAAGIYYLYVEVDATNPNNCIVTQGDLTSPPSGVPQGFPINTSSFGINVGGIAVSKVISGSGASAMRRLYMCGSEGIYKSEITSAGISAPTLILGPEPEFLNVDFQTPELELSFDFTALAWGDRNKLHRVILDGNGDYVPNSLYSVTFPDLRNEPREIHGLEFLSNSVSALYVSYGLPSPNPETIGLGGLYRVNLQIGSVTQITTDGLLAATQLELARNNFIYGGNPIFNNGAVSSNLIQINPANNQVFSAPVSGFLGFHDTGGVTSFVTLPDQIDGENYGFFFGLPDLNISNVTIQGIPAGTSCATGSNVFNCVPITFNASYGSGSTPAQHRFEIASFQSGNCIQNATFSFIGSFTAGAPAPNFDLRTLTNSLGQNLGNTSGRFRVKYFAQNSCGIIKDVTRWINVSAAPQPNAALSLNNGQGVTFDPPNFDQTPPITGTNVQLTAKGSSVSLSGSTGTISSYRVFLEEVNCTNGSTIQTIPTNPLVTFNPPISSGSSIAGVNLNFLSEPDGFFSNAWDANSAALLNKCFKITAQVSNPCGSSDSWTYFKIFDDFLTGGNDDRTEAKQEQSEQLSVDVVPNPFVDMLTIKSQVPILKVVLFDAAGHTIFESDIQDEEGANMVDINTPNLIPGMYFYQVTTSTTHYSGKVIKL
jgi:Secretion system C-terminal sorting domain